MRFNTNLYEERQYWIQNLCESVPQAGFNQLYHQQQVARATAQALKAGEISYKTHALLKHIPASDVHAGSEALRPAREALRAQRAAAFRTANIAAQKKAAALAMGRTALKGAGVVGAAIGAADLGYMAGNAIGNTDVVQDAAGGVGEWWANTMPTWLGGVDDYGLPQGP